MRTPENVAARIPRSRHRRRWWILGGVAVLIVALVSLRSIATLYTDDLWFSSVHLRSVWSTLLAVKVGLFASFGAVFFVLVWVNLMVGDRITGQTDLSAIDDDLVRRYQRVVRPYAGRIYAALGVVMALIAAAPTVGQWNNWILFTNGVSFHVKDPLFHKDVSFYVFRLPFLEFLVNWFLVSLVVVLIVTAAFHYFNGGISARMTPRVRPLVKAHLSVLLAAIALVKAAGYVLQRYQLVTSTNGYVQGAGYTDVHARLPALELLVWISLAAAVVLLINIRRRGWTLPVLGVGLWAFVALVIGVIYPAVLQVLVVNPAQSTEERPYIYDNIQATRAAYGLNHVSTTAFAGSTDPNPTLTPAEYSTLANIRLWDPDPQISLPTVQKLQYHAAYYAFQAVAVDRYRINGVLTPVIVGVRQINPSGIPSPTWVNVHLQYTHGEGMVLAPANQATPSGDPVFAIGGVPPTSAPQWPVITQPAVYFGLDQSGYVVVDTKQPEFNGLTTGQTAKASHYESTGGVRLSSTLARLAFAIREGDLNLLISNQITSRSRIMFVRDVQQMAEKAAPFLSFDSDPYPVLVDGHIDWVIDAYTTTSEYPYSENANTVVVPPGSGLPSSYNYVRNSVKVVINAYTGKMTFYVVDPNDPIIRTYEAAFPHMFTPATMMPAALVQHLRYPEDLFSIQAAMFGRYHITNPEHFFTNSGAWALSPTAGAGPPSQALAVTITTNSAGQVTGGTLQAQAPAYQVMALPGQSTQRFTISDEYVPFFQNTGNSIQNLSAFIIGTYRLDRGRADTQLHVYQTPAGGAGVVGPVLADSEIQANPAISQQISLLDQHGSDVLLGNILLVPLGQSNLYVRPLYVEQTGNPQPELKYVIVVYGQQAYMAPTLSGALADALGGSSKGAPSSSGSSSGALGGNVASEIQSDLNAASADYQQALSDLKSGNLGQFQNDITAMNQAVQAAEALLGSSGGGGSTSQSAPAPSAPASSGASKSASKGASTPPVSTSTTTVPSAPGAGGSSGGKPSTTSTTAAPHAAGEV